MQVHSETMYFASILFLLCALSLVNGDPIFFRGRPWGRHGMMGTLRKTSQRQLAEREPITGQWLEQQLNHFDPSDTRTWKQRFFVNDQFFQPGNPVFLQLGGEGTADPVWLVDGQIAQNYGPKLGAMLIYVEHRYYGQSHPTPDMSVDNLKFLTSQQALADFANFITQYTASNPNLQTSKWVTFGGSYSGSLSAWMRLKYPHLVHAAVASSAPVNAVVNFKQYLGVVRDSLGSECDSNIEQATEQVAMLLQHPLSWRNLNSMFTLCDPLDGTNVNDVANFVQSLSGNFEGVVQYNRDNRAFEGAVDGNVTIDVICDLMQDASLPYVKRYANVNSLILKTYGQKCLDYKYGDFIELLKGESWNTSAAEGGRQWTYQTCVEFGFFSRPI
ncbi:putative serine protease K12H4.7 [Halotydeus destructor]|nr:putative serine protease K12H4.7 [Halotydeus destructor]